VYKGEKFNTISHLVGSIFALAGLVLLVVMSSLQGDPWKIVSLSIYGTSLLILYLSSTLYHSWRGKLKKLFQRFDHISIYLLIAGTYTPLTLVTLRGGWGWSLFGVVWGLALIGIFLELAFAERKQGLAIAIYILMGWLVLIALAPLLHLLPALGLAGLVLGGLFYTGGVAFYVLDGRFKHFHGIWHLFVLAGSICHFLTIFAFVL
jgi:hemolysin III